MEAFFHAKAGFAQAWKVLEYTRLSWKVLENKTCLEKYSKNTQKALKNPWILPFAKGFNTVFGGLNQYKIVVLLFGTAYAAPNKGTIILHRFSKTNIFSNGL